MWHWSLYIRNKRSLLALPCQNKTHHLTSWAYMQTLYFTINNLVRCLFTLEFSIARYLPTKIMLETDSAVAASDNTSFCNKFEPIKLHTYVCAQNQKNTSYSSQEGSSCWEKFWNSFCGSLVPAQSWMVHAVTLKPGAMLWSIKMVLCCNIHFKITNCDVNFFPFFSFLHTNLQFPWAVLCCKEILSRMAKDV